MALGDSLRSFDLVPSLHFMDGEAGPRQGPSPHWGRAVWAVRCPVCSGGVGEYTRFFPGRKGHPDVRTLPRDQAKPFWGELSICVWRTRGSLPSAQQAWGDGRRSGLAWRSGTVRSSRFGTVDCGRVGRFLHCFSLPGLERAQVRVPGDLEAGHCVLAMCPSTSARAVPRPLQGYPSPVPPGELA